VLDKPTSPIGFQRGQNRRSLLKEHCILDAKPLSRVGLSGAIAGKLLKANEK
jgi:hypothetical protein